MNPISLRPGRNDPIEFKELGTCSSSSKRAQKSVEGTTTRLFTDSRNETNSVSEAVVDGWMDFMQKKISSFSEMVVDSNMSGGVLSGANKIAPYALAIMLGWNNPGVALTAFTAGLVARAFSPQQLKSIAGSCEKVDKALPQSVKAVCLVAAMKVAPLFLTVASAFYVGTLFKASPRKIANIAETLFASRRNDVSVVSDVSVDRRAYVPAAEAEDIVSYTDDRRCIPAESEDEDEYLGNQAFLQLTERPLVEGSTVYGLPPRRKIVG